MAEEAVVPRRASLPVPLLGWPHETQGCPHPAPPSTSCVLASSGHTNTLCGPGCGTALKMAQAPSQE